MTTRTKKRSSDAGDEEKAGVPEDVYRGGGEGQRRRRRGEGPKGIVTHATPC